MSRKRKNKKRVKFKYKYELSLLLGLISLVFTYFSKIDNSYFNFNKKIKYERKEDFFENDIPKIEINENIIIKEYKGNLREIDSINLEDYRILNISRKKIDNILEYKKYMGKINKIDELEKISRISEEDIFKIKRHFKDTNKLEYKEHNINIAKTKELKYMGFSNYEIKKILTYRKSKKIENIIELETIVGDSYKNKNIIFE